MSVVAVTSITIGCRYRGRGTSDGGRDANVGAASAAPDAAFADEPKAAAAPRLGETPFNLLVISIDSLRADMPWASYSRPIAPRLSALYARSIAYTRAYSTSSFTSKSIGGFLTGRYPSELRRSGVFFTHYFKSDDFFCRAFEQASVPCIGGHAHAYFAKGLGGFEQGFTDWRLVPGITFDYQTDPYVTSDKLTPLAIEMLSAVTAGDRPFFAWFHYMDPHDEYKPHDGGPRFGTRRRDVYDEEVFFTDMWIGKLLDFVEAQPWAARTVIVVTADHGEAFGEHGLLKHAHELWEELVHVPLFFFVPGHAPRTISEPRSHVDLAPTFGDIVGVNVQRPLAVSLVPELEGATPVSRDVIADLPEDDINERRRALIHGTTKLISFKNDLWFKLFDLAEDPGEQHDLWNTQPELKADMMKRYREASRAIHDLPPPGGIPRHDD